MLIAKFIDTHQMIFDIFQQIYEYFSQLPLDPTIHFK